MSIQTFGTQQRAHARLRVMRGWDPNVPSSLTRRAPVADGVTVLSGQVISLKYQNSQEEWILGVDSVKDIPYFAVQDSDDFDVVASGGLTGLSSLDDLELQTAFFHASPTPSYGTQVALMADSTSGNVTTHDGTDANSILGYTSRFNGPVDIKADNSGVTPDGDGKVLVLTLQTHYERSGAGV